MRSCRLIHFLQCILLTLLVCSGASHAQDQGLSISLLDPPIPVQTTTSHILVYELHLFNSGTQTLRMGRIEVRDNANQLINELSGVTLSRNAFVYANGKPVRDSNKIELEKGMGAVVYMWISIANEKNIPSQLHHKIWAIHTDANNSKVYTDIIPYEVEVKSDKPPVFGPPLQGYNWVAVAGISPDSYHRRAILPLGGKLYLAQRFAIDWEQICSDGNEVHGDMHDNKNWSAFGHNVLAVDNGVVSKMRDEVKHNNIPPGLPNPPPAEADVSGNFVILEITQHNQKYYVLYAHMQPGSIKVKTGDKVTKGQVIGILGNTGNSGAPHLHMDVSSGNDPLRSSGVPFVFENMTLQGTAGEIDMEYGLWVPPAGNNKEFTHVIPGANQVIKFSNDDLMTCPKS